MSAELPLPLQTTYAELLHRCLTDAFSEAFEEPGSFTAKTVRGRRYWYYQISTGKGRKQRYVGPETPELLERITHHRQVRGDLRDRHALVTALTRSAGLPSPPAAIGDVLTALAHAGVFRLRAVLVGTVAYQTYSAMLGIRLPAATLSTSDIDIAQFREVSIAVEDTTPEMLDVLRSVDRSFRPVPHRRDHRWVTTYQAEKGLRVEFLTPNRGSDTDDAKSLPALRTEAQPLRYLDFLIRDAESAALLHGPGVPVMVPAPQRFAVHKLLIAQLRRSGSGKIGKDLAQAAALLEVLMRRRAFELQAAWEEAFARGPKWQKHLGEALSELAPELRDRTLGAVGATRSIIPGLELTFQAPQARYDGERGIVSFIGQAAGRPVRSAVLVEVLDQAFGAMPQDREGRLRAFREHRGQLEKMAAEKFKTSPVEPGAELLIRPDETPALMQRVSDGPAKASRRKSRKR